MMEVWIKTTSKNSYIKAFPPLTWSIPKTELNSQSVHLKTGCVVLKHCRNIVLREKDPKFDFLLNKMINSWLKRYIMTQMTLKIKLIFIFRGDFSLQTSGKESLAKTFNKDVFPHWVSPTTTILHFISWWWSIIDLIFIHCRWTSTRWPRDCSLSMMLQ